MNSYEKINYKLRPQKRIERALIAQLINNLTSRPQWITDPVTGKITGYKTQGGADTVFPFSSIKSGQVQIARQSSETIVTGFRPGFIAASLYKNDSGYFDVIFYNASNLGNRYIGSEAVLTLLDNGFTVKSNFNNTSTLTYVFAEHDPLES